MRSPPGKVQGPGSAGEGSSHFRRLRLTAIANVPLMLSALLFFVFLHGANYETARALFSNIFVASLFLLTLVSVLYHMHLGMQVIIGDYVHRFFPKLVLMILNSVFVIVTGVICGVALLKIVSGG